MLRDLQVTNGLREPKILVRHAHTRWGVVFLVADRFATLYRYVEQVAAEMGWQMDVSEASVAALADATRPLHEAIQDAQRRNNISEGILIGHKLPASKLPTTPQPVYTACATLSSRRCASAP